MEGQSNIVTLFQQAVKVITSPGEFYRAMQKTGGFADPLIFVLVMAAIAGLEIALFSLFGASVIGTVAAGYGAVIFLPLTAAIGSFIGAALVFVVWRLMGSDENYETAYRCIAYAAAIYPITVLIGLLPYNRHDSAGGLGLLPDGDRESRSASPEATNRVHSIWCARVAGNITEPQQRAGGTAHDRPG